MSRLLFSISLIFAFVLSLPAADKPDRAAIIKKMERAMGPLPGADRKVALDPKIVSEEKLEGYIRRKVTFVVEKDGSITDVKVLRGVNGGPGCDKEAIRVVKSMPPWKPGKQNGREVRVQFNLPIKFTLR